MNIKQLSVFVIIILTATGNVFASNHDLPKLVSGVLQNPDSIPRIFMESVDVAALLREDAEPTQHPVPLRVAYPVPCTIDLGSSCGSETLADGSRLRALRISSDNAVFLSFKFSRFYLPRGAELYFISVDRDFFAGRYTFRNNNSAARFGSPMIPGDSAIIAVYLPVNVKPGDVELVLESVSHGYRNVMGMGNVPSRNPEAKQDQDIDPGNIKTGTKNAAAAKKDYSCQRDVNCPEGFPYQDEKRAVAEGYDGMFICSGQLLNNVRQDNSYLYITAAHCDFWLDPPTMTYYWNYENSGCGTADAPLTTSSGSSNCFYSVAGDIHLLELNGPNLETRFKVYFMGWDRSNVAPPEGSSMGFPDDKPKQIHIENHPITDCRTSPCPGGWGPNYWRVEDYEVGVTEGGSSGGGLLDHNHLLIGVLTGGVGDDCLNFQWDEFAKIATEWTGLQPFLDPDNSGAVSVPGKDGISPTVTPTPIPTHTPTASATPTMTYTNTSTSTSTNTSTSTSTFTTEPSKIPATNTGLLLCVFVCAQIWVLRGSLKLNKESVSGYNQVNTGGCYGENSIPASKTD